MNGIVVKHSNYFGALQIFLHSGAIVVIIFLDWLWWLKLIIISICILNFFYVIHRQVFLRSKKSIVKIWWGADDQWYLLNRAGEKLLAEICGDSLITRFLVILNFNVQDKGRKISVILFPDIISKDDFRRLRVHLFSSK